MKGEWINRLRRLSYPSDGKDNTIKIISANTTIEKRIFIPEDMFYHRFNLLGIRLKEMGFPVKMKGFYNYQLRGVREKNIRLASLQGGV